MPCLSIIMPVLDEAKEIADALAALSPLRARGAEIIVVDGGSRDGTPDLARALADRLVVAPRGRAAQMNAGARVAQGDVFVFLHVDTRLPANADRLVFEGLRSGSVWGRFDVSIAGENMLLPVIAAFMNWRSRLTGIATGDQAIFVSREAFAQVGGFPEIALLEDITLTARLKHVSRPINLREHVTTSGRRWEQHGVVRTTLLMWRLRLAYFLGADPTRLARRYGYVPPE